MTYLDASSLLHLHNEQLMRAINLDFRPENDVNGHFYLRVINLTKVINPKTNAVDFDGDWDNLYYEFTSKSRTEIVEKIEQLVLQIPPYKQQS
jgi:hypothetical protein